jgi:hypothetical protein
MDSTTSQYLIWYSPDLDYRDIVTSLLGGIDISLVDPAVFPNLVTYIHRFIEFYTEREDHRALRELQYYLSYIESEPRRREVRDLLQETAPSSRAHSVLTTGQIDAEVDRIIETGDVTKCNREQIPLLVEGLRQRRSHFIESKEYLKADEAERLSRILTSHGQLDSVEDMERLKAAELTEKLEQATRDLDAAKRKWEELHTGLRNARQAEFDQMARTHSEQIRNLEALFNVDPPPDIKKYSVALLQFRRREQAMIQIRQYARAAAMKEQADELQRIEDEQQIATWHDRIRDRIAKRRQKQRKQVNARRAYWKLEEEEMVRSADREVAIAQRQIEHLKGHIERRVREEEIAANLRQAELDECRIGDLPPLKKSRGKDPKADFQHRRIVAAKIYSRRISRTGSPETARRRV